VCAYNKTVGLERELDARGGRRVVGSDYDLWCVTQVVPTARRARRAEIMCLPQMITRFC
jgi:hypothetical protein